MKRTGAHAHVFYDNFDPERVIEGDGVKTTAPRTWYKILGAAPGFGTAGHIPASRGYFCSPTTGTQITLHDGDKVFPIEPNRVCKTTCSVSMEEGTVDVGDDCDPGASILDGNVKVSGSLAGFFRYNDETEEFDDVTSDVLSKFIKTMNEDGTGVYEINERDNVQIDLMINLNSNAKPGQIEKWLIVPAIISSLSINLGNTDVQNKDLSWTKGEGEPMIYSRIKQAA